MTNSPGFHTVIWLAGYRDGKSRIYQNRYIDHPAAACYKSGHLEGLKDRLASKFTPQPAEAIARIKENNEVLGG